MKSSAQLIEETLQVQLRNACLRDDLSVQKTHYETQLEGYESKLEGQASLIEQLKEALILARNHRFAARSERRAHKKYSLNYSMKLRIKYSKIALMLAPNLIRKMMKALSSFLRINGARADASHYPLIYRV
jgi:hypothetical protein